jgi:hypothetical protein
MIFIGDVPGRHHFECAILGAIPQGPAPDERNFIPASHPESKCDWTSHTATKTQPAGPVHPAPLNLPSTRAKLNLHLIKDIKMRSAEMVRGRLSLMACNTNLLSLLRLFPSVDIYRSTQMLTEQRT